MNVTLIGGGWNPQVSMDLYAPFADAVRRRGGHLICLLQQGVDPTRWLEHLDRHGLRDVSVVDVVRDHGVDPSNLTDAGGVMVCGGRNPLYQRSLVVCSPNLARSIRQLQLPYLGFSAGASVGARLAVCGGHRTRHRGQKRPSPVAPSKYDEGLHDLTVLPGLDLAPFAVDVHATQAGTLPRLLHAVAAGTCDDGWAIDADAALHLDTDSGRIDVVGAASIYRARSAQTASTTDGALRPVTVEVLTPGTTVTIDRK